MIRDAFCFNKYIYLLQSCTTVNILSRLPVLAHNEAIITTTHSLELMKNLYNSPYNNLGKRSHSLLQKVIKYDQKSLKKLVKKQLYIKQEYFKYEF
jgi:hypothetical protein